MNITKWKDEMLNWNLAVQDSKRKLAAYRNRYYGKRCFIIGNGPSLNQIDWSLFKDEYTFGLNKIYLLFNKMGFEPSFYTCINPLVIQQSSQEIEKITSEIFLPLNHIELIKTPKKVTLFNANDAQYFSKDASREVSRGYTVTHVALQLAYHMGFRQVILIGVDHHFQFSGLPNSIVVAATDDPNHFDPNYFGIGVPWQLPDLEKSEVSYELAKSAFESDGRIVLDGTIGGKLTVFPKIDYQDVFKVQRSLNELSVKSWPSLGEADRPNYAPSTSLQKEYKVSVIISAYNSGELLVDCISSLENQSISSQLEIIVIDATSHENEGGIARENQKKFIDVHYIHTEANETVYQAWNRGIQIAHGEFIMCAKVNDRYTKGALEKMTALLEANPQSALIYANQGDNSETNDQSDFLSPTVPENLTYQELFTKCFIGSHSMWRKSIHSEFGGFDEGFFFAGDYEFWFRIAQKYPFTYTNEVLGEQLTQDEKIDHQINLWYEKATILKCYKYALLNNISIDTRGLSKHPIFRNWCEINLLIKNTQEMIAVNKSDPIKFVTDLRKSQQVTKLSIVIATYNREQDLRATLKKLNVQDEMDFEVVVVNNGLEMNDFSSFDKELTYSLCFIQMKQNYGPSLARNVGGSYAHSEILAVLDDDAIPSADWTRNILKHFNEENEIVALRGRVLPRSELTYIHIPSNYDLGDKPLSSTTGIEMNCAFRLAKFIELGGFNQYLWFGEGSELSYRLWQASQKNLGCIMYYPDIIIYHDYSISPDHLVQAQLRTHENQELMRKMWGNIDNYLTFNWNIFPSYQEFKNYNWCMRKARFCLPENPALAIEFIASAIQVSPFSLDAYLLLGRIYLQLGEIEKSIDSFEIAIDLMKANTISNGLEITTNISNNEQKKYFSSILKLAYLYLKTNAQYKFEATIRYLDKISEGQLIDNELSEKRSQILELSRQIFQ